MQVSNPRNLLYTKYSENSIAWSKKSDSFIKDLHETNKWLDQITKNDGTYSRYSFEHHMFYPCGLPEFKHLGPDYAFKSLNDYAMHKFFVSFWNNCPKDTKETVLVYLEGKLKSSVSYPYLPDRIINFYEKLLTGNFKSPEEKAQKILDKKREVIFQKITTIHSQIKHQQNKAKIPLITEEQRDKFLQYIDKKIVQPHLENLKTSLKQIVCEAVNFSLTTASLKGLDISRIKNILSDSNNQTYNEIITLLVDAANQEQFEKNLNSILEGLNQKLLSARKELEKLENNQEPLPAKAIEEPEQEPEKKDEHPIQFLNNDNQIVEDQALPSNPTLPIQQLPVNLDQIETKKETPPIEIIDKEEEIKVVESEPKEIELKNIETIDQIENAEEINHSKADSLKDKATDSPSPEVRKSLFGRLFKVLTMPIAAFFRMIARVSDYIAKIFS
jgi:hypothetical protein